MGRHAKSTASGRNKRSTKRIRNVIPSRKLQNAKDSHINNVKIYLRLPSVLGRQTRSHRLLLSSERANVLLEALGISAGSRYGSRDGRHSRADEQSPGRFTPTRLPGSIRARNHENSHIPQDGEEVSPKAPPASGLGALSGSSATTDMLGSKPSAGAESDQNRSNAPRSRAESRLGDRGESHLACPYAKFDDATFVSCKEPRFRRICDVRRHLRRIHLEQAHCPTCHVVFHNASEDFAAHVRAGACTLRHMPPRTMTPQLWNKIRELKRQQASSDEQRWFTIWDTLFPTLPRPSSPYSDPEPNPAKNTHNMDYIIRGIFEEFEQFVSKPPSSSAHLPGPPPVESNQHQYHIGPLLSPDGSWFYPNISEHFVRQSTAKQHSQGHINSSTEFPLNEDGLLLNSAYLDNASELNASDSSQATGRSSTGSPSFDSASPLTHQSHESTVTSESETQEYISEGSTASDSSQETVDEDVRDGSIVTSTRQHVVDMVIDQVMEQFWAMFDQDSSIEPQDGAGNQEPRRTSGSLVRHAQSGNTSAQQSLKRGRDSNDGFGEEENDEKEAPPSPSADDPESQHVKEFGCPFRKHSPLKYTLRSHRVCAMNSWPNIARLKEHLYRNHVMPLHCQRCWANFDTEAQLDAHKLLPRAEMCEVQPGEPLEGITPSQVIELKSRKKRFRCQTEASRWRDIYRLLFPGNEVPSPYFEELEELGFIRREMPRLIRESLQQVAEQQTGPLEQALIQALPRLVQECLERLETSMQGYHPGQPRQRGSQDWTAHLSASHGAADDLQYSTLDTQESGISESSHSGTRVNSDISFDKSLENSETDSQLTPRAQIEAQGLSEEYESPSTESFQGAAGAETFESPTSLLDQLGQGDGLNYDKSIFCIGDCVGNCICWQ